MYQTNSSQTILLILGKMAYGSIINPVYTRAIVFGFGENANVLGVYSRVNNSHWIHLLTLELHYRTGTKVATPWKLSTKRRIDSFYNDVDCGKRDVIRDVIGSCF